MKSVIVEPGQNILDVLLQEQGSINELLEFAVENDITPTEECTPGQELLVEPKTNQVTNYYKTKGITPASNHPTINQLPGGINFMSIGGDFKTY